MGIIPLRFKDDQDANSLKLTCKDRYTISFTPTEFSKMRPGDVTVTTNTEKSFTCTVRFETQRSRACGVKDAYCLLILGDSITTDHISPAGSIHKDSPAAEYLLERGVDPKDFSYGSRSGNDEIMARGTFPNIRTRHYPSGEEVSVFDAALRYKNDSLDTIVLAGEGYGSGSSRDWAAKGLMLLGVKAVIAKSFGRIHRSNLVGMGIIPLCFKAGEDARSLELTGSERYTINFTPRKLTKMRPGQDAIVTTDRGKSFKCTVRFDTQMELEYFKHGGILPYTLRQLLSQAQE